jgi:TolB-like protein
MRSFTKGALVLAAALSLPAMIQAQAKPVVAVLYFDNNSIGKDRADYEGVGKGIAELLINDMAQNPNVKVVERDRVQALLTEQNMTKAGSVDAQTAIKLGKIVGAQYMIYGGFMSDGKGSFVLTGRATNVETGAIVNPVKITSKGDDVLGMIAQLSTKLNTEMKLPALRVGEASPATGPAPAANAKTQATPAGTKAQAASTPAASKGAKAVKMDMRTAMLYSKALEASDSGNKTQAVELFRQVVAKFPDYAPAKAQLAKNGG